jgi:glutaconate CoA-transferase subunit A
MAHKASKVTDLDRAVAELVRPGASIALGLALEGFIPFAAAHQIIRQGPEGLTLIGPISNICFDQLIGAGLVERVIAAWVGNVSTGPGYCYGRAAQEGRPRPLEMIHHSNFSLCLALEAAGRGLSFAVSASPAGSDIPADNPHFAPAACPFTGAKALAVRALSPDVAIIHTQRADPQGNAQCWGATGVSRQAAWAAKRVLVTCEEVVEAGELRADPDRTLVPGFMVDAVCEVPWGAHPAPVQGYYGLDNEMFLDYAANTRDAAQAEAWLEEWVRGVADHGAYLAKLGRPRLEALRVRHPAPGRSAEWGW